MVILQAICVSGVSGIWPKKIPEIPDTWTYLNQVFDKKKIPEIPEVWTLWAQYNPKGHNSIIHEGQKKKFLAGGRGVLEGLILKQNGTIFLTTKCLRTWNLIRNWSLWKVGFMGFEGHKNLPFLEIKNSSTLKFSTLF